MPSKLASLSLNLSQFLMHGAIHTNKSSLAIYFTISILSNSNLLLHAQIVFQEFIVNQCLNMVEYQSYYFQTFITYGSRENTW